MTAAKTAPQSPPDQSEPRPWRTPEDAKGWTVIGVGKRHPRWLEFEIAAIARRHSLLGAATGGADEDVYRTPARRIADRLRALDPEALTPDEVAQLTCDAFAGSSDDHLSRSSAALRTVTAEIEAAWRAYAQRMAGTLAR